MGLILQFKLKKKTGKEVLSQMCVTVLKNMVSTAEIHEVYVFLFLFIETET